MRFFLCAFALAATILAANGFPTNLADHEQPRKNPNSKPGAGAEKPRPNIQAKPSVQGSEQSYQSPNNFILDVAHSALMSELPAEGSAPALMGSETIMHDSILEVGSESHVPESIVQDAIPESLQIETPEVLQLQAPAIESELLTVDSSAASEAMSAAVAEAPEINTNAQAINADVGLLVDNAKVAPLNAGKSRRHAGVEVPDALRIGDFEDVESGDMLSSEFPSNQEQMEMVQQFSKEEMILMAMEQIHKDRPQITMNNPRPGTGNRPNLMNSGYKPHHSGGFSDDDDDEANDSTVDLRNSGEPATIVQEVIPPPSIPAAKPQISKETSASGSGSASQSAQTSHHHTPYGSGSKNKPRPYGMDRPSKNRPTLDSGMKDKNEHFGLPHSSSNDYIQKGEMGLGSSHGSSSSSSSTNYLGFQIPVIKWASLSEFLPTFWGSQNVKYGKSDRDSEACVDDDDDEVANDAVRSPVIQGGTFCSSSEVKSSCHNICVGQGFSSGSCLGPYPTPGCLCRHRSSEEYGLMLKALGEESSVPEANREQDLQTSVSKTCKKCGCMDSCKKSGSFTGFCADKCYCAVPWSMKQL